jgi:FemAB-related protein (PEP-CTERM system-associated)
LPVVKRLAPGSAAAWDGFVRSHPQATFFHLSAWAGAMERAFRHASHYLYAEQDGAITGVLPLVHVRTKLFGSTLISNPFCVYGGALAVDEAARAALEQGARDLLAETGATAAEFRHLDAPPDTGLAAPPDLYVTFRKAIEADHERNMKAIPRKQRAMVRKALSNGLVSVAERHADRLFPLYAESVRNLGTPVFPKRWFRILLETFADASDVVTVLDGDAPIASVLNFYWRDEVLPYYGGGGLAARARAGNDFMYWEVMRRAADRGARLFDFGRSKRDTGAFAFKRNWGFSEQPLHYRFMLKPGARIPEHNPTNPKYRMMIAAWKRLPLPVANLLGPQIVRGIG